MIRKTYNRQVCLYIRMFIYNCLYVLHISKLTIIQKQTKRVQVLPTGFLRWKGSNMEKKSEPVC